ncbi:lactate dehydrogenase [Bifidobacterium sp. SMB2]|uniref:Lactate dehydrogenase n=1 Tax=Bifidobacterium saimiriisciurei TaxID=2661627 RepID=A0ABX0C6U4_9BIFI|nr:MULTISPECIES: D-isomer specific 2-hydroxyacid dehydrogenase family protein [Bifidobacterium]NEG96033.1 lactate dehydrogenase [Bifidobacterium sp. SMB2]NEH10889.1 lactate dehydrogenase [Bifidobacterium saimiriisciurei]
MRIAAFEVRDDEREAFAAEAERVGVDVDLHAEPLTTGNAHLADGCEGVSTLGQSHLDAALLEALAQRDVKVVATRTIGYNHIDLDAARRLGIVALNADYAPNGVAEYTVMFILLVLRNYKPALWRGQVYDFSLQGLQGRELRNLTVGVMGTGRIGATVIECLTGFGCRILAYDPHPKPEVAAHAEYVDLDTLYANSDVITLHMPLLDSTYHIINRESIARMKDGVVLVNCARGELMDLDALIDNIEAEKIGGLGLDTVETEGDLIHRDRRTDILTNRGIAYLRQFPNVVMTQHMAFYTDAAVHSMVSCSVDGIKSVLQTGGFRTRLV